MDNFDKLTKQMDEVRSSETGLSIDRRLRGVGGWLLLFCVGLTILSPLVTLSTIVVGFGESPEVFDEFPRLRIIMLAETVLCGTMMAFSVYAGICLWTIRPGAVRIAKCYLLCLLGAQTISAILPFAANLPAEANEAMLGEVAKDSIRTVIYVAIWYSYLNCSERVRATYGPATPPL